MVTPHASITDRARPPRLPEPPTSARADVPMRRVQASALTASSVTTALLALFTVRPDVDPLTRSAALGLTLLPGRALTWALLAVAALGVVTAATLLGLPGRRGSARGVVAVAALQVLAFGFLAQGTGTLSTAGYLVSLVVPVLAVGVGVQLFRTRPRSRVPVLLGGGLAVAGLILGRDAFATWLVEMSAGLGRERWSILTVLVTLAAATAWAGLVGVQAWRDGSARRATAWVTRHRRPFTILAALGPLPYALIRLTWLTPWPQLGGERLDLAVRIQGLALSSGAWLGFVLTLGLILPWGERFPRWFPGLAGRPVPPAAAIVPGGAVAVMLCGAAIPMLVLMGPAGAVVFPAWLWGPMLALAVWGYAGHRAGVR